VLEVAGVLVCPAGLALVCGAPLSVAGEFCAIADIPKLAASRIAEIEPGVGTLLFTLSPFLVGPKAKHVRSYYAPLASALAYPNSKWVAKQLSQFLNTFILLN
jgi:hypothetical protein